MIFKRLSLSILSAVFLLGASSAPQLSSDVNPFSVLNLQNGATLSVSYVSMGCFHQESGVMEFTAHDVTYQGVTKPLTLLQATQLDNYIRALSEKQGEPGGCTTAVNLDLTLNRNGIALYQRDMTDDFCLSFSDPTASDTDKLLSPGHIKYDLFERDAAEQQTLISKK